MQYLKSDYHGSRYIYSFVPACRTFAMLLSSTILLICPDSECGWSSVFNQICKFPCQPELSLIFILSIRLFSDDHCTKLNPVCCSDTTNQLLQMPNFNTLSISFSFIIDICQYFLIFDNLVLVNFYYFTLIVQIYIHNK